ncbi:MAG: hypothetical protein AUG51_22200 [Acidobacteria bacterium 13_1_20CM_3_53_8]|nr:MAG: hypothetical protein AUH05_05170 [Ktedonobacter sp. 13_2_20CM_53_11]OLE51619.1 MAG: hypothetical protein AUG51_22200 [Acidobacteria bacterium 13_1_20CM_3_53_8]
MPKPYPVGKAQQIILDALGRDVESFQEAEKIFADLRIIVTPVRQGHDSVPHVSLNHLQGVTVDNLNEMREINEPYSSELVKIVQWMDTVDQQIILHPEIIPEVVIHAQKDAKGYGYHHLQPGSLTAEELFEKAQHWLRIFSEERTSYSPGEKALYRKEWSRQYCREFEDYWSGGD